VIQIVCGRCTILTRRRAAAGQTAE